MLDLIGTGASYREMGLALGVALGTIQTHIKSIYAKLGVGTKAEAVRWLLSVPSSSRASGTRIKVRLPSVGGS